MCGRYYIALNEDDEWLNAMLCALNHGIQPSTMGFHMGDIFPTDVAPVILNDEGRSGVRLMKWGFPRTGGGGVVINSRSEKADYTPMFQKAVRERRCLIPMTGFYEWRRTPSGGKTKEKFAFRTQAAQSAGRLMYLAGVYGEFLGGFAGGGYDGFAVLTQDADEQMNPYHSRMPVILEVEEYQKAWLFAPPDFPYGELRRMFAPPRLDIKPAE